MESCTCEQTGGRRQGVIVQQLRDINHEKALGTHTLVKDDRTWPSDTITLASRRTVEKRVSVLELTEDTASSPPSKPSKSCAVAIRPSCTSSEPEAMSPRRTCMRHAVSGLWSYHNRR
jgi:hypothetical protein